MMMSNEREYTDNEKKIGNKNNLVCGVLELVEWYTTDAKLRKRIMTERDCADNEKNKRKRYM